MDLRYFIKWLGHTFILITLVTLPAATWADNTYSNVFIFGDSLSDTGNYASIAGKFPNPPYYKNRISNGLIAVDILAKSLNLTAKPSLHLVGASSGTNYAVYGARSSGVKAIDLPAQINAFLSNQNGTAPENALYVVFIGSNDVLAASNITDKILANQTIDTAVMEQGVQIQTLIDAGAKYLLVINVVDISVIPAINQFITQNPQRVKQAKNLSKRYNTKLKRVLKEIEHSNKNKIELLRFNLYEVFKNLLNDAQEAGFTNTTEACFSSLTLKFNPGCEFGANFPNYIFFDEFHPTARVHKIIGELISEEVE